MQGVYTVKNDFSIQNCMVRNMKVTDLEMRVREVITEDVTSTTFGKQKIYKYWL